MPTRRKVFWIILLLVLSAPIASFGEQDEQVVIRWDTYGVPHVFAQTNSGVFFGAGYAVGRDRLTQINQFKLLAEGRLAEAAGVEYLRSDCRVRRDVGGLATAHETLGRMSAPYTEWLDAYARGINKAIADMGLAGAVEPWTPADVVAIERYVVWEFSQGKTAELERMATLGFLKERFDEKTAEAMWRDLMSPVNPAAITTIPPETPGKAHQSQLIPQLPKDALNFGAGWWETSRKRLGSNAVVVAPGRSITGNPLLISNTQLEAHFPSVYYELHLCGGDFNVSGFTIPGFPAIGFGHNDRMAWTITVGCSDQQDVYEEVVRMTPCGRLQYLFQGLWLDCSIRTESIRVKGYPEPALLTVASTIHGPIEMLDLANGRAYTTRWGPYLDGHTLIAYFEMDRAKTMEEFARALAKVEMSFNFLYADVDGNIAFWHAGEMPERAEDHTGIMPVSGTGEFEWRGFVPFDRLPHLINPPQGILLLENNRMSQDTPAYDGSLTSWGTQRMERLAQLADKLPDKMAMEDLELILSDTHYLIADRLKPELLRVIARSSDPRFQQAAIILKGWNNSITSDSAAATIFFVWLQRLGRNTLSDEFGEHCLPSLIEKPHLPLLIHAFEGRDSLLPPSRDYFDDIRTRRRETRDDVIAVSLAEALDECQRSFETASMEEWRWGEFSYWDLGPIGKVPDTYMDPNRHHTDVIGGGASSQLIEVEEGFPNARNLMPPGNSGTPASPHARDQVELFVNFKYKPVIFNAAHIQAQTQAEVVLNFP